MQQFDPISRNCLRYGHSYRVSRNLQYNTKTTYKYTLKITHIGVPYACTYCTISSTHPHTHVAFYIHIIHYYSNTLHLVYSVIIWMCYFAMGRCHFVGISEIPNEWIGIGLRDRDRAERGGRGCVEQGFWICLKQCCHWIFSKFIYHAKTVP